MAQPGLGQVDGGFGRAVGNPAAVGRLVKPPRRWRTLAPSCPPKTMPRGFLQLPNNFSGSLKMRIGEERSAFYDYADRQTCSFPS